MGSTMTPWLCTELDCEQVWVKIIKKILFSLAEKLTFFGLKYVLSYSLYIR